jgi:hypothetical protein
VEDMLLRLAWSDCIVIQVCKEDEHTHCLVALIVLRCFPSAPSFEKRWNGPSVEEYGLLRKVGLCLRFPEVQMLYKFYTYKCCGVSARIAVVSVGRFASGLCFDELSAEKWAVKIRSRCSCSGSPV